MSDLPTGTVTFLFTDIEGSTALWEQQPEAMRAALARHDALLRAAIEAHGGLRLQDGAGDSLLRRFARRPSAGGGAGRAARAARPSRGGDAGPLRVRMALHTGDAEERDGDYFGPPLNRVARLLAAGHGGQVLLSGDRGAGARPAAARVELRDLGEHRLKDLQPARACLPARRRPICPPTSRRCARWTAARTTCRPSRRRFGREREIAAARARLLRRRACGC